MHSTGQRYLALSVRSSNLPVQRDCEQSLQPSLNELGRKLNDEERRDTIQWRYLLWACVRYATVGARVFGVSRAFKCLLTSLNARPALTTLMHKSFHHSATELIEIWQWSDTEGEEIAKIYIKPFFSFLQRVSISCYTQRAVQAIDNPSVRLSVRPSVCLSVCHTLEMCQNDSSYDHAVFTQVHCRIAPWLVFSR